MLVGMTGFGVSETEEKGTFVRVEAKSWNAKGLDVSVRAGSLPVEWEEKIRTIVKNFGFRRGNIRIDILTVAGSNDYNLVINKALLKRIASEMKEISSLNLNISLSDILSMPGIVSWKMQSSAVYKIILKTLKQSLEGLLSFRMKEGEEIMKVVETSLGQMLPLISKVEERINRLDKRLLDALSEGGKDIFEEVKRLKMNYKMIESELKKKVSSGRKVDFISQEILRETNTLLAKVSDRLVTRWAIEIKQVADRIREVVQNAE